MSTNWQAWLDSDDFRDEHERAFRGHVLGGPESHICDDLCSAPILDRMAGRTPNNEWPPKPTFLAARHRPQSHNGCLFDERRWSEHTAEEKTHAEPGW